MKNLGQIKAIHVGSSAPTNIKMLWYNTVTKLHYYYSTLTSAWTLLASSGSTTSGKVTITTDPQTIVFSIPVSSTNYVVMTRVYNDVSNQTDGGSSIIFNKTINGFDIISPITGSNVSLEYIVKQL